MATLLQDDLWLSTEGRRATALADPAMGPPRHARGTTIAPISARAWAPTTGYAPRTFPPGTRVWVSWHTGGDAARIYFDGAYACWVDVPLASLRDLVASDARRGVIR